MASNEHKNLSNANLHLPLDFSVANNSTVLTKNSAGSLDWAAVGTVKIETVTVRGFTAPVDANYKFPVSMNTNKDLYFNSDFTTPTIGAGTFISVSNMVRASVFVAPADCTIVNVYGWVTGTVSETVTFALLKGSNALINNPIEFAYGAATQSLVVLDEFTALTYGSNVKIGLVDNTSFVVNSLSKGDFLMPMIKSPGGANDTFFHLSIEIRYNI